MLTLRVKSESEEKIVYDFFPENTGERGTIELNKNDGEISVIKVADGDEYSRYLHHAVSKAREFFEKGHYEDNISVAWY